MVNPVNPLERRARVHGGVTLVTKRGEEEAICLGSDTDSSVFSSFNWRNSQQSHYGKMLAWAKPALGVPNVVISKLPCFFLSCSKPRIFKTVSHVSFPDRVPYSGHFLSLLLNPLCRLPWGMFSDTSTNEYGNSYYWVSLSTPSICQQCPSTTIQRSEHLETTIVTTRVMVGGRPGHFALVASICGWPCSKGNHPVFFSTISKLLLSIASVMPSWKILPFHNNI